MEGRHVMRTFAFFISSFFVMGCAFTPSNQALAHQMPDAEELGASIRVLRDSPVNAIVSVKPKVSFSQIEIGLGRNAIGGPKTECVFSSTVVGQTYTCQVQGDVISTDTGLVIRVSGMMRSGSISNKSFTIPNPNYDRQADRALQKGMSRGERTLVIQPEIR